MTSYHTAGVRPQRQADDRPTDQLADLFAEKFAERISPVASYVGAMYGDTPLTTAQTEFVIRVVVMSVEHSSFTQEFYRGRAAKQALNIALRYVTGEKELEPNEIGYIVTFERHASKLVSIVGHSTTLINLERQARAAQGA